MPEFSNYVESLDTAVSTTGTILIPVSHDGDPESFTPAQIVEAGGGALGFTPENVANKVSSIAASATQYPNNNAVIAYLAPYILDQATPSTAGGTITLDMNNQVQRMFVGSASFGTAKAIDLSNTTNSLVLHLVLTLTNVAAVLTFPTSFTMQAVDSRWNDSAHTFTPVGTGKHEFSAVFDGTDWNLKATYPFS